MDVSVEFKLLIRQDCHMNRWTNSSLRCLGKPFAEMELNKVFFEVSRQSCIFRYSLDSLLNLTTAPSSFRYYSAQPCQGVVFQRVQHLLDLRLLGPCHDERVVGFAYSRT